MTKRKAKAKKTKRTREKRLLKLTTRETVAERQELLAKRVEMDRNERYKEYIRKIKTTGRRRAARAMGAPPTILAEGDSWFEYPLQDGGVIDHLQEVLGIDICNMAHHGDEVREMMGLSQRKELIKRLSGKVRFDVLLFSGGGNDLVGDQFCIWLNEYSDGSTPYQIIDQDRLSAILSTLEAEYRDLIAIRDQLSPQTKLFFHGYDFPDPNGKKACFVGPWLKPSLDFKSVPQALRYDVVKIMLDKFGQMLQRLANEKPGNVFYVQTQNTLQPTREWWANEIHPSPKGFRRLAEVFKNELERHM